MGFEWRLIFTPSLDGLPWFVESPKPPRLRWAWARTTLRVLTPWRFWRDVRVESPIGARGVVEWLAVFFGISVVMPVAAWPVLKCLVVVYEAVTGASAFSNWGSSDPLGYMLYEARAGCNDVGDAITDAFDFGSLPAWLLAGLAATSAFPGLFLLLPYTRRASKVRAALVWRAAAYSIAWLLPFAVWQLVSMVCMMIRDQIPWNARPGPTMMFALDVLSAGADYSPFNWDGGWSYSRPPVWLAVLVFAWIGSFWLFAMRRSWRMRDWWAAWTACAVVAFLLSAFAVLSDAELLGKWY